MKSAALRSVEDWRSALTTLPDSSFYELIRSYLGDIRTPFNKQRLVEELEGQLSRRDIQDTLAAYLDQIDRRVIAALRKLSDPTAGELASFFEGEYSFAELHGILLNLEERLILFRVYDQGTHRLALNPLFAPVFAAAGADEESLFPSWGLDEIAPGSFTGPPVGSHVGSHVGSPAGPSPLPGPAAEVQGEAPGPAGLDAPTLTDPALGAYLSFLYGRLDLFKADGSMKKKALDDALRIFVGHDPFRIIRSLGALGIYRVDEDGHRVDEDRLSHFAALPRMERLAYLAAGLCIDSLGIDTERRRQYRERLHSWARLAFAFLEDLAPDRAYPETTLLRLLDLKERLPLEGRRPWEHGSADPGAELRAGHPPLSFRRTLLESMNAVGLISPIPGGAWGRTEAAAPHPVSHAPRMIMSASYSCILYPEMPFQDALALARFCEVREVGRTVLFEINRDSVVRGFNLDLDVESVASILQGLSGKPLDQALLWSLKEWNDRYSGLALHRGIILTVAEDRAYLAKAEPVASMISRTLAPGVFLLSVPDESEAVRLLKKAGVDIVALPPLRSPAGGLTGESRHAHFPRLAAKAQGSGRHQPHRAEIEVPGLQASDSAVKAAGGSAGNGGSLDAAPVEAGGGSPDAAPRATDAAGRKSGAYDAAAAQAHLDRFRSLLEKKRLPKDQRDELSARINRRLILSDSQLVGAAVRYEKLEAKGLDYVGKVRVAEQAISTGSLVELFWRGPKGEPNRVLGSPKSLEKADGELMLIIEPVPQGDALTVAIGKISLLRRIKRSIFGE